MVDNLLSSLHRLSLATYCLFPQVEKSKASAVASVRIDATAVTNIATANLIFALHSALDRSVGGKWRYFRPLPLEDLVASRAAVSLCQQSDRLDWLLLAQSLVADQT